MKQQRQYVFELGVGQKLIVFFPPSCLRELRSLRGRRFVNGRFLKWLLVFLFVLLNPIVFGYLRITRLKVITDVSLCPILEEKKE